MPNVASGGSAVKTRQSDGQLGCRGQTRQGPVGTQPGQQPVELAGVSQKHVAVVTLQVAQCEEVLANVRGRQRRVMLQQLHQPLVHVARGDGRCLRLMQRQQLSQHLWNSCHHVRSAAGHIDTDIANQINKLRCGLLHKRGQRLLPLQHGRCIVLGERDLLSAQVGVLRQGQHRRHVHGQLRGHRRTVAAVESQHGQCAVLQVARMYPARRAHFPRHQVCVGHGVVVQNTVDGGVRGHGRFRISVMAGVINFIVTGVHGSQRRTSSSVTQIALRKKYSEDNRCFKEQEKYLRNKYNYFTNH